MDRDTYATLVGQPKRFLIVLMGSVGDVARGLTVAQAIKRHNTSHHITWVVEPASYDLVSICPAVDSVIVFERRHGLRALPSLRKKLRHARADITLDLQRHLKSGIFSWLSAAPIRLGFNTSDSKECNHLFQTDTIASQPTHLNKMEHYWEFLKKLSMDPPTSAVVELSLPRLSDLSATPVSGAYVVLVLGTRWQTKRWPITGYAKLIELMQQNKQQLVLVGGSEDAPLAQKLTERFSHIVDYTAKTTIPQLCTLLKNACAVVGPDSGPAHLAAALDVPHVTLFGPTSPSRTAPYGLEDLVVQTKVGCAGCYRRKCPGLDVLCMHSIAPHEVYAKVLPLL